MDHLALLTVAAALLGYGLVSRRLQGSPLTGPLLFAGFGLLTGPAALGWVPLEITNEALHYLAQFTLVLVLFSDAASIDLGQLRRDHDLPVRMLLVGMPLTIALGAAAALALFPGIGLWEAALLAAILAPTDAALGQAVVSDRAVPVRIRQALNVESGLNDGIALPFVLVFAALAGTAREGAGATHWVAFALLQVTLGPLVGVAAGWAGGKLVARAHRTRWMTDSAEGIIALALAFGAFALAEAVHGNGFIAAFVAGLVFGNTLAHRCAYVYEFAETEGQILVLLTFLAFGSAMLPLAVPALTLGCAAFALLALTVVRMVPVGLSLLGTGVRPVTGLFLGWFGPRGLASVLFVLLILERTDAPNRGQIFTATILTVAASIVLHGVSAGPAARRYGAAARRMGACEENRPVPEEPFAAASRPEASRAG